VALLATREALDSHPILREARFWLYDDYTHNIFQQQLNRLGVAFPQAQPKSEPPA
jgi:hypothetical protein